LGTKVVNDTLKSTIKEVQSSVELTELVHPTTMSSYLCGNNGALKAAAFYDSLSISENKSFSWVGLVLQRGLQPNMSDGKGGVLSSITTDRAIELITEVPTAVPHTIVMNGCALMQIDNDDMTSDHLRNTNRTHLREPLTRSALWLSEIGIKMLRTQVKLQVSTSRINCNDRQCRHQNVPHSAMLRTQVKLQVSTS